VIGHPPLEVVVAVVPPLGEPEAASVELEVACPLERPADRSHPACAREEQREAVEVEARRVELPEGVVKRRTYGVEVCTPGDREPALRKCAYVPVEAEVVHEEVRARERRGAGAAAEVELARDRRVQRSADPRERPHRPALVPEPVGVLDLLEHLAEHPLRRLPRVELDLRVQPEPHRAPRFRRDMSDGASITHPLHRTEICSRRSRSREHLKTLAALDELCRGPDLAFAVAREEAQPSARKEVRTRRPASAGRGR